LNPPIPRWILLLYSMDKEVRMGLGLCYRLRPQSLILFAGYVAPTPGTADTRVTETGDRRVTETGDVRVTET
jgi:hypothetical protein